MMTDDDLQWLVQQLVSSAEVLGQQITPTAAAMMADDLSVYPKAMLARALSRVRNEHSGRLTPKAIIDRIDEAAGRPAANEAWAIACTALDESQSLVWNNEISDAWVVSRPIAEAGDMIGARMAFIGAYERIVRNAREMKVLPEVIVSLGWDKATTNPAIEKALALGYISPIQAKQHCVPALEAPVFDGRLLLTGRIEPAAAATPEVRAQLMQLREELAGRSQAEADLRFRRKQALQHEWQARKDEAQRRVTDLLAAQSKGEAE